MAQSENAVKEVVRDMIRSGTRNIHTAIPGKVISYDAGTNRASVQPFGNFKVEDGSRFPYPVIYNVPVIFPTGMSGAAGVTFPICAGDGCLLVFSEVNLDDFLSGGDSDDLRMHSMNDAICIPGLYSSGATVGAVYPGETCLFHGGSMIRLSSSGIVADLGGTSVTIGGGDMIVNGISVVHHTHSGIMPGGSHTAEPD